MYTGISTQPDASLCALEATDSTEMTRHTDATSDVSTDPCDGTSGCYQGSFTSRASSNTTTTVEWMACVPKYRVTCLPATQIKI